MIDNPILQAHKAFREKEPDAAAEIMAEVLEKHFPSELTRLHLCVSRLMLDYGLGILDALELAAKIGILLQQEKEGEK